MKNALKNSNSKFILIGKINGLSEQTKRARLRLRREKERPWIFALRKYLLGRDVRHHLLAYAFLRGVPYYDIEPTCREGNKPISSEIFKIIAQHAPSYIAYDPYNKSGGGSYSVTAEDVNLWLNGEKK